jgi:hypothetical protein
MNSILEIALRDQAKVSVAALDLVEIVDMILKSERHLQAEVFESNKYLLERRLTTYKETLRGREWVIPGLRQQAEV